MKTALVVGATGLVGRYLLSELLANGKYEKVVALVRSSIDLEHPGFEQMVVDFDLLERLEFTVDDVYCCMGTTLRKAGSQEAFRKVDRDYPVLIAKLALQVGANAFGIVTSMGADPKSRFFYNRVKGEVEGELDNLGFKRLLILRPSMLLGDREEVRWGEGFGKIIMQWLSFLIPLNYKAVHGKKVARAMRIKMENADLGKEVLLSGAIQAY